jgi:hypothetical protein
VQATQNPRTSILGRIRKLLPDLKNIKNGKITTNMTEEIKPVAMILKDQKQP